MSISLPLSQGISTIVFVDAAIDDHEHFIQGMATGIETVSIPATSDGVQYITDCLAHRPEYSQIHIVAHGEPGTLSLGSTTLSVETLDRYAWRLQQWFSASAHLTSSALVLYSCDVAAGTRGTTFLHRLQQHCGVAIAASSTPIGATHHGGNWDLDQITQPVGLVVPFWPRTMKTYAGVLGTIQGRLWQKLAIASRNLIANGIGSTYPLCCVGPI